MKKCPRYIFLTQGKVALVDWDDYELLAQQRWNYAGHYARQGLKKHRQYLHRVIMGASPTGVEIDHINGDKLDNRRCNLRFATRQQQSQNSRKPNKWGFKGVSKVGGKRYGKPFTAMIRVNGRKVCLGYFATPEEAAHAYDKAAIKWFGAFARPNFEAA